MHDATSQPACVAHSDSEYTKPQHYPPALKRFSDLQTFNTMRISDLTDFSIKIYGNNRPEVMTYALRQPSKTTQWCVRNSDPENPTVQDIQNLKNLVYSLGSQPLLVPPQTVIGLSRMAVTVQVLKRATATLWMHYWRFNGRRQAMTLSLTVLPETCSPRQKQRQKIQNSHNLYPCLNYVADLPNFIAGYGTTSMANLEAISENIIWVYCFKSSFPED